MGFYRTYEELKQPWVSVRNWKSNRRFYRTYEELKLGIDYITGLIVAGVFYRTYEELKLAWGLRRRIGRGSVFIVPMRNWNK